jgi:mannan endo-1,4-beta-mannosidase
VRRAARILIAAGVTTIVLAVAAYFVLSALRPKPAPTAAHLDAGGYLGVSEAGEISSYQPVSDFAAEVGRQPDIVLFYGDFGESFQSRFAAQVHAHGATPFVQIEPENVSLATIASGADDAYLRAYASQIRSFGHPVIIGFGAEMNGDWDPWGYGHASAATFVAAWRHIVTVFRAQGTRNVIWLWTVDITGPGTGPVQDWWPGASYVTWVGIDGYYVRRSDTFDSAILPTIGEVRIFTSKPILLSETGIGPAAGQAAKMPDLFTGVRANHLVGLVWFDRNQNNGIYHQDWQLKPGSAGLAAFRRQLQTYHQPAGPPSAAGPTLTSAKR